MQVRSRKPGYESGERKVNTAVGEVVFKDGVAEVSNDQWKELSQPRYSFMQLTPVKKGEEVEMKEAEPKKTEVEENEDKAQESGAGEGDADADLEAFKKELAERLDDVDKMADLKEIAELAELPEEDWKGIKAKADLKAYLEKALKA